MPGLPALPCDTEWAVHSGLRNTVLKILHSSSEALALQRGETTPGEGQRRKEGGKKPEELYRSPNPPWYQQKYRRSHVTELSTSQLLRISLPLCFSREFPILITKRVSAEE